jgi:DNA mismatch repair protein MutH
MLILYFHTLLKVLIRSKNLLVDSLGSCLRPAWVCCMNLTKSGGEWEVRYTQTYRHKTENWDREGYTFLVGNVSTCLSQSIYFIGQYKEKAQVKNQASTVLWYKVKGMRSGALIFLRLMKLNYNTFVLESSRHAGHLI